MGKVIKSAAGPLFFGVFAILFLLSSYAVWPSDFSSTPFSAMTTGTLLRALASPMLAFIGIEFLAAVVVVLLSDS